MRSIILAGIIIILGSVMKIEAQEQESNPSGFSAGLITGYNAGYGVQANFTIHKFPEEFPFQLRFGIGYTFHNPGIAPDARRIFINNATNGVPEKKGRTFDYRLDFLLPSSVFGLSNSYIVFGPRYSTFKGNFKFIGGNEDFDVISAQWGAGGGIESHFKMAPRLHLVLSFGLDYYFPSTLKGHDTSYSPDNDNINPRDDNQNGDIPFVYKDADRAINQPKFMPRAMMGLNFSL